MSLPLFDTIMKCAACGRRNLSGAFSAKFIPVADAHLGFDHSYIRRQCSRCGYTWKELPLYLGDE